MELLDHRTAMALFSFPPLPMPKGDQTPATKSDLKELEFLLKGDLQQLEDLLKGDFKQLAISLNRQIEESEIRIFRHFDLAVENIRHELLSANRDELEVIKDRHRSHEQRISALERSAGLARR